MSRAALALLCACCLPAPPAQALQALPRWPLVEQPEPTPAEVARKLLRQGHALRQQGRLDEALAKYTQAAETDGKAALPLSSGADLLYEMIDKVPQDRREEVRRRVAHLAREALQRTRDDPVALAVLRKLDDDAAMPLREPNAAAAGALSAAEAAYAGRDWRAALAHYQAAMTADPASARAFVGAGACHVALRQWREAEALFLRATGIEPRYAEGWRHLSDVLVLQGRVDDAIVALEAGIAAHPAQRASWQRLSYLRMRRGTPPLERLDMHPLVRLASRDGRPAVAADIAALRLAQGSDLAVAMAQGNAALRLREEQPSLSPFQVELRSWREAFRVADELAAQSGRQLTYPSLLKLRELDRASQLDAAILLLRFREAYRPDLEAWLASRPHAVREFVAIWSLQP